MGKYEFEFFQCTGRLLFMPVNDMAIALCKTMRRKNLTEIEVEFYARQGYPIQLQPRINIKDSLKKFLVGYEVATRE